MSDNTGGDLKSSAEQLLNDPNYFKVVVRPVEDREQLRDLAPLLREFFERYEKVFARFSELILDRSRILPVSGGTSLIEIGTDCDGEFVFQALPGDERIFTGPLRNIDPEELDKNLAGATIYDFLISEASQ